MDKRYENFIIFLAPFINSVAGIAIDLYAPSLPSIGREFSVNSTIMQNTITITLLGYAIGQLFFGFMSDYYGRRKAINFGLVLFIVGSLISMFSSDITTLLIGRAIQGFAIGACQVVARAVLVDNIKGERFYIAILYLSLAFGLGPVIAPYIGGYVEELAGWRYNFLLYSVYSFTILLFVYFGLKESLDPAHKKHPFESMKGIKLMLADIRFSSGIIVLGTSFSSFLIWNVIGPFIVQEHLSLSSSFFGQTALGVGLCYLVGTLANRVLVKSFKPFKLMGLGLLLYGAGLIVIIFNLNGIDLYTVLIGTMFIAFGQGFLFSNAMAKCMSLFVDRAGTSASLQGCLMLLIGSTVTALTSQITITSNLNVAEIFILLFLIQLASVIVLIKSSSTRYAVQAQES
ncbi:multidrug effflux MFS transporter [Zooshikella sp. RANM57]|uniref:multidrug effflux MFS transporter n=1 Tax=Zooshikella sp. RANM57 TaxID=3425863 RepID=UPI003D6DD388